MARTDCRNSGCHFASCLGDGGWHFDLWCGGSTGVRAASYGGAAYRKRAANTLVQLVRPAKGVAGDDSPSRGRRLLLLSALLYGTAQRRRKSQTSLKAFRRVYTRNGNMPVVPLRGSSAR